MEPFDSIEKLITEHGSAAILREHIALLKSQMTHLASENTELKTKVSAFEIEVRQLRGQLGNQHPISKPADTCPYCRRAAGELVDLKPHLYLGMHGIKNAYYKCSNCGKSYDKQTEP